MVFHRLHLTKSGILAELPDGLRIGMIHGVCIGRHENHIGIDGNQCLAAGVVIFDEAIGDRPIDDSRMTAKSIKGASFPAANAIGPSEDAGDAGLLRDGFQEIIQAAEPIFRLPGQCISLFLFPHDPRQFVDHSKHPLGGGGHLIHIDRNPRRADLIHILRLLPAGNHHQIRRVTDDRLGGIGNPSLDFF